MLYLTRKIGESVIINDEIEITVIEVRGRSIKLGFTFPPHVSVLRREIYERIQAENKAASQSVGGEGSELPSNLDQALPENLRSKLESGSGTDRLQQPKKPQR